VSLKDKLRAKTAGIGGEVDAELSKSAGQGKALHPRTAIGQTSAFQMKLQANEARIAELEAQLAGIAGAAVPVDAVDANPWQPRRVFNEESIRELAASIEETRLLQPIVVRRKRVQSLDTRYELVAGERRLRAHKLLGRTEIEAHVVEVSNEDMASLALVENIEREDLSDYEIAKAIRRAESEFPTRKEMARALGMKRSDFYRYLAFEKLPPFVIADLDETPGLLGRSAAEQLQAVLNTHGEPAVASLLSMWPRVIAGDLDQTKVAELIESAVLRGVPSPSERDIRKLFVGEEQAGSITRDSKTLTVKLRSAVLTPEKEAELRAFVERLLIPG
jgi:ParB family transcriptional regulator, chromosome partitioning protein